MSKVLIAFASKSGTAKEAAERICSRIPSSDVVDLTKNTPSLANYDAIIIGGGVRVGAVHKDTKRFIDAQVDTLATLPTAYFITNSFIDDADEIINKMLPPKLKEASTCLFAQSVGGKMETEKLKGMDKIMAVMATKAVDDNKRVFDGLDEDALDNLAACIERALPDL